MPDEEIEEQIENSEHEDDVYEDEGREELVEDDEIDPAEEGFMQGYEQDEDDTIEGE